MTFQALLDRAAGAATCQFLQSFGSSMVSYGAWSAASGAPALVPLGIGAASLLASNYGCNWDSGQAGTVRTKYLPAGCQKATTNCLKLSNAPNGGGWTTDFSEFVSLTDSGRSGGFGTTYWDLVVKFANGVTGGNSLPRSRSEIAALQIYQVGTCSCLSSRPVGEFVDKPPSYDYTDTDTGCKLTVNWEGLRLGEDGRPYPIYKIEPKAGPARASGAIIGGCNFSPVLYVGGGGGGGIPPVPYPPSPPSPPDRPWWWDFADDAIGGIVGAVARKLLEELLQQKVAGRVYRLASACEVNDAGEPIDQAAEVVIPDLSMTKAIVYRLDALEYLLQAHKDFKQPVCSKRDPLTGEPVTVRFQSDENSDAGDRPLLKSLTYRDQSFASLETHVDHWADFAWQAGPVCVISKGLSWGFPQVWASSAEEGKRVLSHAASVAGVDLGDPKHKWLVTGSSDGRYGRNGTMRVRRRSGALCVSKRNGPSGLPLLASPAHP